MLHLPTRSANPITIGACLSASLFLFCASPASAHFSLTTPANWMSQDAQGTPQKAPPCGNEAGGTASGKVTTYQTGSTFNITLSETVFHPGHYRVALSTKADRSDLPAEPAVTAGATLPCGTAAVQNPAVFPVLVDNALDHTAALAGSQTISVKLPAGVTCTNCTLQIIEFMSNHGLNNPGGCYYHHCANIAIQDAPVPVVDMADTGDASMLFTTEDMAGTSTDPGDMSATASTPTGDMAGKPPAASSGLPGCEMGGHGNSVAALFALMMLFAAALAPRLRRARRK